MNATLKYHILKYEREDPDCVQSPYYDDKITGDSDNKAAYQLYMKTKSRLAEARENVVFRTRMVEILVREEEDQ